MESHELYAEIVATVAQAQTWKLTLEQTQQLTELVAHYSQQNAENEPAKLAEITINLWHDYSTVQCALDPQHPQYQSTWDYLYEQIMACLKQRQVVGVDALYLDERSPDLCAYADLKQKLHQFRFESRLRTYVYNVTWRAVLQWRRAGNALKRGGLGFNREATTVQYETAQQIYYLSQQQRNQDYLLEELLVADDLAVDAVVMVRQLKREISLIVDTMHDDPLYAVARRLWHELLFEQANISALAQEEGLKPNDLFNLRARLGRRCRGVVEHWREQTGE